MTTPSPIAEVRASLTADRERLREAVDRVPARARETKPAPDRWSTAEVLEHLALVETRVVMMLGLSAEYARTVVDVARYG